MASDTSDERRLSTAESSSETLPERLVREAAAATGEHDKWLGKRRQPRAIAGIPLDMEVAGKVHYVQCHDASLTGLQVHCRELIRSEACEDGVRIRIAGDGDDAWTPVTVEHVTRTVAGFRVGLSYKDAR